MNDRLEWTPQARRVRSTRLKSERAAARDSDRGAARADAAARHTFADLGSSPLANSYLTEAQLENPERYYPLRVYVCDRCFLVQLPPVTTPEELFADYAYFSSYSDSWLDHARDYVEADERALRPRSESKVVEIASNDGYLLQYFARAACRCSASSRPRTSPRPQRSEGSRRSSSSSGWRLAERARRAQGDARRPRRRPTTCSRTCRTSMTSLRASRALLKPDGVATLEFPHLLRLIEGAEFDTIYHEHFSYFSLTARSNGVFAAYGLRLFDVEELPTHGGSLAHLRLPTRTRRTTESRASSELRERERDGGSRPARDVHGVRRTGSSREARAARRS